MKKQGFEPCFFVRTVSFRKSAELGRYKLLINSIEPHANKARESLHDGQTFRRMLFKYMQALPPLTKPGPLLD